MSEQELPKTPASTEPIFAGSETSLSPTLSQALNSRGIYRETGNDQSRELPPELLAEIFPSSFEPAPNDHLSPSFTATLPDDSATPPAVTPPAETLQPVAPPAAAEPAPDTPVPSRETSPASPAAPPAPTPATAPSLNEAFQELSARAVANAATGGAGIPIIPGENIQNLPAIEFEEFTPFVPVFEPSTPATAPSPPSGYSPVDPPYTGGITVSPMSSIVKQPDTEQHAWMTPLTALSNEPAEPYVPPVSPPSPAAAHHPRQHQTDIPALAFTKQSPSQKIQSAHNVSSLPKNIFAPVEKSELAESAVTSSTASVKAEETSTSKRIFIWGGITVLALGLGLAIYYFFLK